MKVFYVSWNDPETVFPEILCKENFTVYPSLNRVVFKDGGTIISDREKVADTFKKVFMNTGSTLKIDKNKRFLAEKKGVLDPFVKAIKKYSVNLNIPKIKQKVNNNIFLKCHLWKILNDINDLDTSDRISIKSNVDVIVNLIVRLLHKI